jgi:hypothetical protein
MYSYIYCCYLRVIYILFIQSYKFSLIHILKKSGFWLKIPLNYHIEQGTKQLHLISRISEISDFNYLKLLNGNLHEKIEDKNKKIFECNPQILLLQKNNDIVLQISMTIYKNLEGIKNKKDDENSSSQNVKPLKKREINNISLISDKLPRDVWIHCAVETKETVVISEKDGEMNDYKEIRKKNGKIKMNKNEKTTVNLFLNGSLIHGECAMGGRTPVYQNVIIGCIPSNLGNERFSNIINEREIKYTNIDNYDRNDYEKNNDDIKDNRKNNRNSHLKNENRNLDVDTHNNDDDDDRNSNINFIDSDGNDHSTGPLLSDVYWLPTTPLASTAHIIDPSLWGRCRDNDVNYITSKDNDDKNDIYDSSDRSMEPPSTPCILSTVSPLQVNPKSDRNSDNHDISAADNEYMVQPPSLSQLLLTKFLDTGIIILETSIKLLFSSFYEKEKFGHEKNNDSDNEIDHSHNDNDYEAQLSPISTSKISKNVEKICLLALDLIASGNDSIQENTFRIMKHFMAEIKSNSNYDCDNNDCDNEINIMNGDHKNEMLIVNSIILRFLDCLVVFVNEYNIPSMSCHLMPDTDFQGTNTLDMNIPNTDLPNVNILHTNILDTKITSPSFDSGMHVYIYTCAYVQVQIKTCVYAYSNVYTYIQTLL